MALVVLCTYVFIMFRGGKIRSGKSTIIFTQLPLLVFKQRLVSIYRRTVLLKTVNDYHSLIMAKRF